MASTAADNKEKMTAAVSRWIAEASVRADGQQVLRRRSAWVSEQIDALSAAVFSGREPPPHLEGLTATDLACAEADLSIAAANLKVAA